MGGAQIILKGLFENDKVNENFVVNLNGEKDTNISLTEDHKLTFTGNNNVNSSRIQKIKEFIIENEIEVVHCHLLNSLIHGFFLQKSLEDVKFIYHEHGGLMYIPGKKKLSTIRHRAFVRVFAPSFDNTIAISKCVEEELKKLKVNNVIQIYNPLDMKRFSKANVKENFLAEYIEDVEEKRVIGFAGRLVERKGWRVFLELAEKFKNDDSVVLTVAGQGEDGDLVKAFVQEHGLEQKVYLLGVISDMPSYYTALDVFVVPSTKEPMGLVQIESMAMGTPVITTDAPAFNEMIFDGENGYLFEVNNVDSLYDKVTVLLKDEGKYKKLVENGYNTAQKFSIVNYLERLNQIYQ